MNDAPLLHPATDSKHILGGIGTTKFYELIAAGLLDARKIGGRTMITAESLRQYVASLPKANIKTGQRPAA